MKKSKQQPSAGAADKEEIGEGKPHVSAAVIRRLPRYHRYLGELLHKGQLRISSAELSKLMRVTASQIRQDLNCFGGFGQQGYGYNVRYLHGKISELLGVNEGFGAVIVGAGNLGRALAASPMFEKRGVSLLAIFDVSPAVIGTEIAGMRVLPVSELSSFCIANSVSIGVLTTPRSAASATAEALIEAGVVGIWNFSNVEISSTAGRQVIVQNMHLGDSLMTLCYEMKKAKAK